jgi:hypothetical protein
MFFVIPAKAHRVICYPAECTTQWHTQLLNAMKNVEQVILIASTHKATIWEIE